MNRELRDKKINLRGVVSDKNYIVRLTIVIFIGITLFLSFLRAPYFGEFLDGLVFDLMFFGTAKYIFYLASFIVLIILAFRQPIIYKIHKSKMFWLFILLVDLFILLIFGIVHYSLYLTNISQITLSTYVNEFFMKWTNSLWIHGKWLWQNDAPLLISGGLINSLFIAVNAFFPALIAVELALIVLTIIILFIGIYYNVKGFVKLKNKFIKVLGGVINKNFTPFYERWRTNNDKALVVPNNSEEDKESFVKEKQIDDLYYGNQNLDTHQSGFSNPVHQSQVKEELPEIRQKSVNERELNQSLLEVIVEKLEQLFKKENLDVELIDKKCGPTEVSLAYEFSDRKQIKRIKNLDKQFVDIFESNVVSINQKGNIVYFYTKAFNESKISLVDVMIKPDETTKNQLNCAIGIDQDFNPINFDLKKEKSLLFIGGLGSGKLACTISSLISLAISKPTTDLQLAIIDLPDSKLSKLDVLGHLVYPPINSIEETNQFFEKIMNEMKYRNKILEENNLETIDEYNDKNPNQKIKDFVICINDINDLLDYDFSNIFKIISYIYKVANKINVYLVLVANQITKALVDDDLITYYGKIINLRVDTPEESDLLVNNKDLYKLHKNGDFYVVDPKSRSTLTRGLSCFVEDYVLEDLRRHYSIKEY
ncbi:cell division protein FtsK [Mycoplasma tullyi]|uniref:Cell division protein FtsK n=1 Tax=Mycoplasma tullyi TaxID=1612150 RepID=A0A7D7U3T9_9MOLU|nr:FtsK/SpoIIIE domain-containing protein [Mycoplasma tullyi]QMT98609.1 cell division protein FtsK [Mycoplasma tullyi]